jgi:hypothetical protein
MIVSPDCWAGKHRACDGAGWDMDLDQPAPCQCPCHTAPSREPGGRAAIVFVLGMIVAAVTVSTLAPANGVGW